jgi:hypothetical protein
MESKAGRITIKRILENSASTMERSSCSAKAKAGHRVIAGITRFAGSDGLAWNGGTIHPGWVRSHFVSENAVGVLPVTCRNACENAGTLA